MTQQYQPESELEYLKGFTGVAHPVLALLGAAFLLITIMSLVLVWADQILKQISSCSATSVISKKQDRMSQ